MSNVRSITPLPPADFTPQLGNYRTLQPFRYWCQKVLPLVYDDSLSYYELLCKVVDYLNKAMEDVETLHGDVTNLHTAYEELQSYVNNYFSSLDVQEEINNKLDKMASDGSLVTIMSPVISTQVSEWLSKNITPTTPAIDKSLTISGAGADAKVVGDLGFISSDTKINDTTFDLNNCVPNRVYIVATTTVNKPTGAGSAGIVWSFARKKDATNTIVQFYCDGYNRLYSRFNFYGTGWGEWSQYGKDIEPYAVMSANTNITDSNFDLNNCTPNRVYIVSTTTVNKPTGASSAGIVWSFAKSKDATSTIVQFYCDGGNTLFSRFNFYGAGWSEWTQYGKEKDIVQYAVMSANTNITDSNFDLNNCTPNRVYIVSTTTVNKPTGASSAGIVWSFAKSKDATSTIVQFYCDGYNRLYLRFNFYGAGWGEWSQLESKSTSKYYNLSLFQKVGVIGDSYASGELWNGNTYIGDIYSISWLQQLARIYGFTGINFSEGGLTTRTWLTSDKGLKLMQSSDNCDLMLLCLGINDYYHLGESYLGSASDIGTNNDTFYGNYSKIINDVITKNNKTRMIIFTLANPNQLPLIDNFNTAIKNIAAHFSIPVGDLENNYYVKSDEYKKMSGGHPTVVNYNGLSTAYSEVISDTLKNNQSYFNSLYM